jgi:hypothetical protein
MDIYVDTKRFENVFSEYIQKNAKVKIADELNKRAANIIMTAMKETKRADRNMIEKELKVTQFNVQREIKSGKRKGELTKGKMHYQASVKQNSVFKILNWRRKFRSDSLPKRLQGSPTGNIKMKGLADKFVKSVKSSCGYIAAGWIPALRVFLQASRSKSLNTNDASQNLQKRFANIANNKFARLGYGNLANASDMIMKCTFGNAARGADVVGKDALVKAINKEIGDMKFYIESKIMGLASSEISRLNKLQGYMNLFGKGK